MQFKFDPEESRSVLPKHGVSLEQAQEVFDQAYLVDKMCDNPEPCRAMIFEIRSDASGERYRLITAWKATRQEQEAYAEQI